MNAVVTLLSVILVRVVLEYALVADHSFEPFQSLLIISLFFIFTFAAAVLLAAIFASTKPSKALDFLAKISPLILLPLLLDVLLNLGGEVYYSFDAAGPTLEKFLSFCGNCEGITVGIRVEVLLFLAAMGYFVHANSKNVLKTLASVLLLYGGLFILTFMPFFASVQPSHSFRPVAFNVASAFYAVGTAAIVLVLAWLENKNAFKKLASNSRVSRALHYVALFLAGVLVAGSELFPLEAGLRVFAGAFSIFFAFQTALVVNDYFDKKIDASNNSRRPVQENPKLLLPSLFFFLALALLNALPLGYEFTVLVLACLAISFVYSAPPLRLRNHFVPASFSIAAISVLVLFAGASAVTLKPSEVFQQIPFNLVVMFFASVFLASNVKDLKDVEGDERHGVKTIPVLFPKHCRKVLCVLIALAFLSTSFLSTLKLLPYAVFFTLTSCAAVLAVKKPSSVEAWFFSSYFALLAAFLATYP